MDSLKNFKFKNISENIFSFWVNFLVFLFCISVISIDGHGGQAAIGLLITSIFFFTNNKNSRYKLDNNEIIFISLVVIFWSINLLNTLVQPEGLEPENLRKAFRGMDNPMRWILMLPLFFLFCRVKLDWRLYSIGISLGVLISVSISLYALYFLGNYRDAGGMNHIITFAEIMVISDIFLWTFMTLAWKNNYKKIAFILLLASLVAFYGALMSAVRGALILYIFLALGMILYSIFKGLTFMRFMLTQSNLMRLVLGFMIIFLVFQISHNNSPKSRIFETFSLIKDAKFNQATSGRVEIFMTAISVFKEFPFGVGTDNYSAGVKALIIKDKIKNPDLIVKNQDNYVLSDHELGLHDQTLVSIHNHYYLQSFNTDGSLRFTSKWRHAHNEWLNVLVENGFIGFLFLTLLFAFPLKIFLQKLNHSNQIVRIYSCCGMFLIFSFVIFGQTQSVFTSHAALMFFIFFLYLFLGQISLLSKEKLIDNL